jgi:hypothetical protein
MATKKAAKKVANKAAKKSTAAKRSAGRATRQETFSFPMRSTYDGAGQTGTLVVGYTPVSTSNPIKVGGGARSMSVSLSSPKPGFITITLTEV